MSLTQSLARGLPRAIPAGVLRSPAVAALASPHAVDRYLEVVDPMWAVAEVRARVVGVRRETADVTTLTLEPTSTWEGFRAGQFVQLGVEVDGSRRTTRCFSISSSEGTTTDGHGTFTITVRAHEDGLVSKFLATRARPGLVVHLSQAQGDFTLPSPLPERLLMISGGSGITPVMSMLRTLVDHGYDGRIRFVHYSRSPELTIFREELEQLAAREIVDLSAVPTRDGRQRFTGSTLRELAPDYAETRTFACGPAGLVEQVRDAYAAAGAEDRLEVEYFKTATIAGNPDDAVGQVSFSERQREHTAENSGATLLEQAEGLGLQPEFGCRMGICFSCTSRKREGTVRNVVTGASSSLPDEDIRICVSTPVGDCAVDL